MGLQAVTCSRDHGSSQLVWPILDLRVYGWSWRHHLMSSPVHWGCWNPLGKICRLLTSSQVKSLYAQIVQVS